MRPLCVALAIALCACQQKSPDERLKDTAKDTASWAASLSFTAEEWAMNSVPKRFVRTSVDAADKALEKTQKDIAKSDGSRALRDRVAADVAGVKREAEALRAAAERSDRLAAVSISARLNTLADDLQQ